jgi:hypothetical protein
MFVAALGIVMVLAMGSATLLMRGVTECTISERSRSQAVAFQLADAAVDQAALNLRTPTDASDDMTTLTFSNGTFTIGELVNTPIGSNVWQVVTEGSSTDDSTSSRSLEVTFQLTPQSIFQYALFGDQGVSVSGSAITNSYDSTTGPFDDTPGSPGYNKEHNGDVGTTT